MPIGCIADLLLHPVSCVLSCSLQVLMELYIKLGLEAKINDRIIDMKFNTTLSDFAFSCQSLLFFIQNKRIKIDEWTYQLDRRDLIIQNARADKIAREILETNNPPPIAEEIAAAH